MNFWNFVHYSLGLHVYEFLTILTAAVMAVVGVIHGVKQIKREKKYSEEESEIREE